MGKQPVVFSRRLLLQAGAGALAAAQAPSDSEFRTIAYNVLACLGYAAKAPNQWRLAAAKDQMEPRMAQELLLYRPDILTFSESLTRPAVERVAKMLRMSFAYFDPGVPFFPGVSHRISGNGVHPP